MADTVNSPKFFNAPTFMQETLVEFELYLSALFVVGRLQKKR